MRVTGTSLSGVPFSRSAVTPFTVVPPLAQITSFQEALRDDTGGGKFDRLVETTTIAVQTAGQYRLSLELVASNGQTVAAGTQVKLGTGTQSVDLSFSVADLLRLGVDGPYERENIRLIQQPASSHEYLADSRDDGGPTIAVSLASLDRGPLYFTGQNAAEALDTDGDGVFDVLRAEMGVFTPASGCEWGAVLRDPAGRFIAMAAGSGTLSAGNNTISVDFSGVSIAQARKDGPYLVSNAGVDCGGYHASAGSSFQTPAYTASQFKYVPQGFTITIDLPQQSVPAGMNATSTVSLVPTGEYRDLTTLSVAGLPPGASVSFYPFAQLAGMTSTGMTLALSRDVPPGTYTISVVGTNGTLSASTPVALTVTAPPDFSLSASPDTLTVAPGSSASYTVSVATAAGFQDSVYWRVTNLPAGASATVAPETVTGAGTTTVTITTGPTTPLGTYAVTITGTAPGGNLTVATHSVTVQLVVDATALPSPWMGFGIGAGASTGTANHLNGTFSLSSPGTGLAGTADSFTLACQPLSGDATLVARVADHQSATTAGIMFRDTPDAGAANVFTGVVGSQTEFQHRDATGGDTTLLPGASLTDPYWFKLTRAADAFTAYASIDGVHWTSQGQPVTIGMVQPCAGLAVASGSADFDDVVLSQSPDFYFGDPNPVTRSVWPSSPTATYGLSVVQLNSFADPLEFSVAGLPAGAKAYFSPYSISGAGGTLLQVEAPGAPAGTYTLTISATNGTLTHRTTATLVASNAAAGLPDPWTNRNVGPQNAGTGSSWAAGSFSVTGGGADSLQFAYQPLIGDMSLVARVVSAQNPLPSATAGVMIRESLAPDAAFAVVSIPLAGGLFVFQGRNSTGAAVDSEQGTASAVPSWIKLVRTGDVLTAFSSPDGATWSQVGTSRTIPMAGVVYAGLAVTSGISGQVTTAVFDSVAAATPTPDFSILAMPAGRSIPPGAGTYFHTVNVISLNGFEDAVGLGVAGLPPGMTATTNPVVLAPGLFKDQDQSLLEIAADGTTPAGVYPITVTATGGEVSHAVTITVTVTAAGTVLPSGWGSDDVGAVGVAGSTSISVDQISLTAAGVESDTRIDSLRYAYQVLDGDGSIVVHPTSWAPLGDGARFGAMIRESLAPNAANACMCIGVTGGTLVGRFEARAVAAGKTAVAEGPNWGATPPWLKLVRSGDVFTGYTSDEGLAWTQVGTAVTIEMPRRVFIGVAANSGSSDTLATVAFEAATLGSGWDFYLVSTPKVRTIPPGGATYYHSILPMGLNGFDLPVTFSASEVPSGLNVTFNPESVAPNDQTILQLDSIGTTPPGTYPITVTATSGAIQHSLIVTVTVSDTGTPLPSPWSTDDIGAVPFPGAASIADRTFTVQGSGGIGGYETDAFRFLYKILDGDGELIVRLDSTDYDWSTWSGIMLRESLLPSSPGVTLGTLGVGLGFIYRTLDGTTYNSQWNSSYDNPIPLVDLPLWLKLTRAGDTFSWQYSYNKQNWGALWYRSADGSTWLDSIDIKLPRRLFAGMFQAGNGALRTAIFSDPKAGTSEDVSVTADPVQFTVGPGLTALQTVSVRSAAAGPVALSVTGLPAGVAATFARNTLNNGELTNLTIAVPASLAYGTYPFTITASAGALVRSLTCTMTVRPDFNITVNPSDISTGQPESWLLYKTYKVTVTASSEFNGTVTLSADGAPSVPGDPEYRFDTPIVTGSGTANYTIPVWDTNTFTYQPSYTLTFTGTSGNLVHKATATLEFRPEFEFCTADWSCQNPSHGEVVPGSRLDAPFNILWLGGFKDPVNMSVTGLPAGVGAAFNPTPVVLAPIKDPGGRDWQGSRMSLNVGPNVPVGTYPLTVTATSGTISHSVPYSLSINGFTLAASPGTTTVAPGDTATYTGTLTMLNDFAEPVTFSAAGLPAGATATFAPVSSATSGSIAMTIATSSNTPPGTYPVQLTGSTGYVTAIAAPVNLVVNSDFTLTESVNSMTVTASGNSTNTVTIGSGGALHAPVTFAVSGLPAGATARFGVNPLVGTGSSVLTISVDASAIAGTYTLAITATSGTVVRTQTVTLAVMNFSLAAAPATLAAAAGGNASSSVSLVPANGFSSAVTFSASGLPDGVMASFTPSSLSGAGAATMTLAVGTAVASGTYPFTVTGISGALQHSVSVTLVVTSDFSISAGPSFATIPAASSANYSVSVIAAPGFSGTTTFSASGLPAGAASAFVPASVTGPGSSILTVSTSAAVAAGSYAVTITATAGTVSRTAVVSLTVLNFGIAISTTAISAPAGGNAAATVTISPSNDYQPNVTFSAAGLPAGVTASFAPPAASGAATTTLSVALGANLASGTYPFAVIATCGALQQWASAVLTVTPGITMGSSPTPTVVVAGGTATFPISIVLSPDLTGLTTFTVSGIPPNATATFTPASFIGSGSTTLSVNLPATAPGGTYSLTVTAMNGSVSQTTNVTLAVQSFSIAAVPNAILTGAGRGATSTVTLTMAAGFNSAVTFATAGLPAGVTASFDPGTTSAAGNVALTLATSLATSPGTYPFTITATSGVVQQSVPATLRISASESELELSIDLANFRVGRTLTTGVTLSVASFNLPPASLSVTGLPSGATATFAQNPLGEGQSTVLTVAADASLADGVYPLTVSAASGGIVRTVATTMTVGPDFQITVTPKAVATGSGNWTWQNSGYVSLTVTVATSPDFNGTVVFSQTGAGSLTAPYAPAEFNPTSVSGAGSATYGISIGTRPDGLYPVVITGTSGDISHSVTVPITLQPDFMFNYACSDTTAAPGSSFSCLIGISWQGGLTSALTLSTTGLPPGVTESFSTNPVLPLDTFLQISSVTVNVPSTTPLGAYNAAVRATDGELTHTKPFVLTVSTSTQASYTLSASPDTVTVAPGSPATYTATLTMLGGYSNTVWFNADGLPSGVWASFNPSSTTVSGPVAVTINTFTSTPPGAYHVRFIGTSGSSVVYTPPVTLVVTGDFTLTASAGTMTVIGGAPSPAITLTVGGVGGFRAPVNLALTGLPTGMTPAFGTNPVQGPGTSLMQVTADPSVAAGTYLATIVGTSGQAVHSVTVAVTVASFSLSAVPSTLAASPGSGSSSIVTVNMANGYASSVMFGVAGLPSGVTPTFTPASRNTSGDTAMVLAVATGVAAGTYPFTITGTSGTLQQSAAATLIVTPDFSVVASPGSRTIAPAGNTTFTVSVTPVPGASTPTTFTVSGLPDGATGVFTPSSVTGSGSTTLTVTATIAVAAGNCTPTITATNASAVRTTAVGLAVQSFAISTAPTLLSGGVGWSATSTVTLTMSGGFSSAVAFAAIGLPSGVTAAFNPAVSSNAGNATLTVSIGGAVPAGDYPFTITATSGGLQRSIPVTLRVTPDFSVAATPPSATLVAGSSTTISVVLAASIGLSGQTSFVVEGLPANVGATFNPPAFAGSGSTTLSLTIPATVAGGTYAVAIKAINGSLTHAAALTLTVQNISAALNPAIISAIPAGAGGSTLTLSMLGGYSGTVVFDTAGLPLGATASFEPVRRTTTGYTTLTVAVAEAVAPGSYNFTVTCTSGALQQTIPATLAVAPGLPDLVLTVDPGEVFLGAGLSSIETVTVHRVNGVAPITLSLSGLPAGITSTFGNNTLADSGSTSLTLSAPLGQPLGSSPFTIVATSGALIRAVVSSVTVRPDFSLTVTPSSATGGASYDYLQRRIFTVTVTPSAGFTDPVSLTVLTDPVLGIPEPAICDPLTITGAGTATCTLGIEYTYPSAPAGANGTYSISFTGQAGNISHSIVETLTLQPDFDCLDCGNAAVAVAGVNNSFSHKLLWVGGLQGPLTLSATGFPPGVVPSFSPNPATFTVDPTWPYGANTSVFLYVPLDPGTPPNNYNVTIVVTNGTITHTYPVVLQIAGFTLSASPSTNTVAPGGSATFTGTITALNGYNSNATFSIDGLPTDATATFSKNYLTGAGNTTITIQTATTTPVGVYPLVLKATCGNNVQSAPFTLVVGGDFTIATSAGTTTVTAGSSGATNTITIGATGGFGSAVNLSAAGLPIGATASFGTNPVAGAGTSVLTLSANATVAGGSYLVTITGTSGAIVHTKTITLTVKNFSLAASPSSLSVAAGTNTTSAVTLTMAGGYNSTVTFGTTGLPAGATASFSPASSSSSSTTTLTVTTTMAVLPGAYSFLITGTNGSLQQSSAATLTVTSNFTISVTPSSGTALTGGSAASFAVTVSASSGLSGATTFGVSPLPSNVTSNFNPASVTGSGSSTMTLTAASGATAGSYPLTVTATNGSLVRTASVTLTVQAQGFSLAVSPTTLSGPPGGTAAATVTLTMIGGYATAVNFSASGLPTGATAAFSPTSRTSTGTTALTVTIGTSVAAGNYPFTITGTSGSLVQSIPATLTVAPDFSLSSSPTTRTVVAAGSGTYTVTLTATAGLTGATALSVSGLPTNATAGFSPTSVTGSGTSTLTVTVPATVAGGTFTLTITGTNGSLVHSITVTLTVQSFTLSASPATLTGSAGGTATSTVTLTMTGGYATAVNFSASGLPTGATAAFNPTSRTTTGTTALTVTIGTSVAAGNYSFTITGTSGSLVQSIPATLTVTADFLLSSSPTSITVVAGGNGTYTVSVAATPGLTGATALSVSGLPTNATAGFNPTSVTGSGTSTLTVTVPNTVTAGSYPLTVTGTNGSLVHSITVTLIVQAPSFTLAVSPSTPSGPPGGAATATVTLTMLNGYATAVNFSASGLPTGATAAFNPTSRTSTGTTALTVTIGTSVAAGNYPFTITGTSGSLVQSIPATLTVAPDFSLSSSPTTKTVVAAGSGAYTVTVTATAGLTGATALSVSGLPTNATAAFSPTSVTGSGTSTLTVTVPATVAGGASTLTITGTNGSKVHSITVTLTVQNFTLSASPTTLSGSAGGTATSTVTLTMTSGYATAVNFTASGLPTGATAAFNPTSRTSTGTTALTVTIGSSVAAGSYPFTITGTSGSLVQSIPATLTVTADFSLSSSPTSRTLVAAGSGTYTVTVTATAGLTGATALSVSGLPTNATAGFSPTSVTGSGTSTLTVTVPATVAGGTSTLTITGTNGTLVHSIAVTLTVQNFTLSASPSTLSGSAGGTATSTVTLTMTGGYATAVNFAASGLPTGATAAFSPTSLTSTGTTTLTVTIATSVAAGSYPFTVTGTSGSLVQSIPATLTVTPDFSLASSPTTRTVVAGGTGTFTVTVTATAGLTGATALTVTGLPTNATAAFSPTSVTGSGTSALTVTVPATVAGSTSTLTITGTNGSKVHSITVTLTVQNFTLSASPTSITVTRGGATLTDTITVTMTGGFSSSVALSSSVTPTATGLTITFNPTSRTTTGTSTMSVKATTSTAKGTYTIKVTGTSGTLVQSTNVTLVAN